jgi:hypothetical protein
VIDLDKSNIVEQKYARFADACDFFDSNLGGFGPVAAPVESPGTAKYTIPRATPAEFDRRTGVQNAVK